MDEMFESEYSHSGGTENEVDPDSVEVRGKKGRGNKTHTRTRQNVAHCEVLHIR